MSHPTPRTDALAKKFGETWNQFAYRSDEDFAKQCRNTDEAVLLARQLERENAAMREALSSVVCEIEWFVSRKKDLSAKLDDEDKIWADILDSDLDIARAALKEKP